MVHYCIYSDEGKLQLKLRIFYNEGNSDHYKTKSRGIKATKNNIALLRKYAEENKSDYEHTEHDCNGSKCTRFFVKVKKNKCWLKEHTNYDY